MTKPKFTPGPWLYERDKFKNRPKITAVAHCGDYLIGIPSDYPGGDYRNDPSPDDEADARLIAAAPDLYEALKSALSTYREQWMHPGTDKQPHLLPAPEWVLKARAALAKVEEGNDA